MSITSEPERPETGHEGETVAMVLRHLTYLPRGATIVDTALERGTVQRTAMDWQEIGAHAQWAELLGATSGAVEGRMATRALAEMCGYYLLAAAHGLGNVTVRTLMLSGPAATALKIKVPEAKGFPPFSEDRAAWPPLNSRLAAAAKDAAVATGEGAAVDLAQVVVDLLAAPRWTALVSRRDTDYHRWRPQGLPSGGVPQRSLWDRTQPGTRTLSGRALFYDPVDHKALCRVAGDALDELDTAMRKWLEMWPGALTACGAPLFKSTST